jgi:3',5'-cyclic AMP phosphodiesterase CpdA
MRHELKQIAIIHLSDVHFGDHHRFQPPASPDGGLPAHQGYPSLLETLRKDWEAGENEDCPLIIAVTGDLTQKASAEEFDEAAEFLQALATNKILGRQVLMNNIFIIPGNHDILFEENVKPKRWEPYCSFYQNLYARPTYTNDLVRLNVVHDRSDDLGAVIVEINSCEFIVKGSVDEKRGQVPLNAIQAIKKQLQAIDPEKLAGSMRIALVHHHPVLLPVFAEPKRGYDSIINADQLLKILRDFGFHLVLHGHKHFPHIFSYDAESAWTTRNSTPTLVVAGGSAGSTGLPQAGNACNTYNLINVKLNPKSGDLRVKVETRGLVTVDQDWEDLLPGEWHWKPKRTFDRVLAPLKAPAPAVAAMVVPFDGGPGDELEEQRKAKYKEVRGNVPLVQVIPSLKPEQAYEARVWIVPHKRSDADIPVEVVWSAGEKFTQMFKCEYSNNPKFSATFGYYMPMMIQARMRFKDDTVAAGYVYAWYPGGER